MYREFFELLSSQPLGIKTEQKPLRKDVLTVINECLEDITPLNAKEIMESYFIDLSYGNYFGLELAEILLEIKQHNSDSLGIICTYLSYYPSCDHYCFDVREQIKIGNLDNAKKLLGLAVSLAKRF